MMDQSLVISFTADQHVEFDTSFWLKMEQVGQESDVITVSDVAAVLDALYGTTPCVSTNKEKTEKATGADDTGKETTATTTYYEGQEVPLYPVAEPGETGGEDEEDADQPPTDEDTFNEIVSSLLNFNSCKDKENCHTAQLRVYRSHQAEPYKIIPGIGTITQTKYQTAEANETPAIEDAAGYNLSYPLAGDLQCGWKSCQLSNGENLDILPEITVDASTLSWGVVVTGLLDIKYMTEFDLVDIEVPLNKDGEMQDCSVLAYYHGKVYRQSLKAPKVDPTVDEVKKAKLCKGTLGGTPGEDEHQSCYKEVHHDIYCQCSNFLASSSYISEETVPCPAAYKGDVGRFILGVEHIFEGSVDCGELTACHSPYYYKAVCCKWPAFALPKCFETHAPYAGGKSINGGAAAIYAEYGENTKIVGIGPKLGPCGSLITRQVSNALSCCDVAEPIVWNTQNSATVVADFSNVSVFVSGGIAPYTWLITGQGFYLNPQKTAKTIKTDTPFVAIYTGDACGVGAIRVTDDCTEAIGYIRSTNGQWQTVTNPTNCFGASGGTYNVLNIGTRYKTFQPASVNTSSCESGIGNGCTPAGIAYAKQVMASSPPFYLSPPCFGYYTATITGQYGGQQLPYEVTLSVPPLPDSTFDGYTMVAGIFAGNYGVQEWVC